MLERKRDNEQNSIKKTEVEPTIALVRIRMEVPHSNVPPDASLLPVMRLQERRRCTLRQWKGQGVAVDQHREAAIGGVRVGPEMVNFWINGHFL